MRLLASGIAWRINRKGAVADRITVLLVSSCLGYKTGSLALVVSFLLELFLSYEIKVACYGFLSHALVVLLGGSLFRGTPRLAFT